MDKLRIVIWVAIILVALSIFNLWQREHAQKITHQTTTSINTASNTATMPNNVIPSAPTKTVNTVPSTSHVATHHSSLIHVKTDVLDIAIDKKGGSLVSANLLKYPASLHASQGVQLLNNNNTDYYVATSGITGKQGPDSPTDGIATYQTSKTQYQLAEGQNQLNVDLTWQNNGVTITKRYLFSRDSYSIKMQYIVKNNASTPWAGNMYLQLMRKPPENKSSILHYGQFTGAAVSSPAHNYQKYSFSKLASGDVKQTTKQGWAAMVQHYFLSAWVPPADQAFTYRSLESNGHYLVGMIGPEINAAPGQTVTNQATFYTGPAIAKNLDAVAPHLSMTIDYGWLWFISKILFWIMTHIYAVVGNWGIAIILLTIMIKLVFFHLSTKSYRSMGHMRRLQPRMKQLKERHGDDKAAFSKAMMTLYKKEKVNPVGSCLPMLIQIPFFIALYYMIIESVQLRQAPFFLWVHDLSVADPFYILPVIMGGLMFLQQRLNPPAPDPIQQKVMMFLPVVFTFFFLHFPAGLVLYWITNTGFGMAHQWWCIRSVNKLEGKAKK